MQLRRRLAEFRRVRVLLLTATLLLIGRGAMLSLVGEGEHEDPRELQHHSSDSSSAYRGRSARSVGDSRPRVVLLWTEPGQDPDFGLEGGNWSFADCPISSCVLTTDRRQAATADAVLFDSREIDEEDLPSARRPEQKYVLFAMESPISTKLNLKRLNGFFNLTMTYRRDSDIYQPFGETDAGAQTEEIPDFKEREPAVVWMADDNCRANSQRENYMSELGKYIFVNKVGSCGAQDCDDSLENCYHRQAARSLFALSFEESLCEDFITDQFWLALRAGLVPVVRGPDMDTYRRVAPPNSFIHVGQFGGPHGLSQYLLALSRNQTAYHEYQAWRATHHVRPSRWNGCDLCTELWKEPGGSSRNVRISDVWSPKKHCSKPVDLATEFFMDRLLKLKTLKN